MNAQLAWNKRLENCGIGAEVAERMTRVPQHARLRMTLGTIDKSPENPNAWLHACLRNYEQQQQAKVLLGSASVHARDRVRPPSADRGAGSFAAAERSPALSAGPIVTESSCTMARGTQPTEQAMAMKVHWPKNKSGMISSIMGVLEEDMMDDIKN